MADLLPILKSRFFDSNGNPLAGGKLFSYQAGTSTPAATYTDQSGISANTNPVILDANGEANIWIKPGYLKFILTDKDDVVIYTVDKVGQSSNSSGGLSDDDYAYSGFSSRFGQVFSSNGLNDTLEKILNITYTAPSVSLSASGSTLIYEKGATVASTTLSASVTKKSDPILAVRFYQGATLLDTQTSGGSIPNGGVSSFNYSIPFTDTISFNVQVDDSGATGGPSTVASTASFTFVYPYYSDAGAIGKSPSQVGLLTKSIINSTATVVKNMTATTGQVFYFAFPTSYGALTSILDINNFETIADWTLTTANIVGLNGVSVSYKIYEFKNPVTAGTYQYTFKR